MTPHGLRIALATLGISQAELARCLGRPPGRISAWVTAGQLPVEVRLFVRVALDHGLAYAKGAVR